MLTELFKRYRTIGIVGNTGTGKSMLALTEIIELKQKVDVDVYVLGAEPSTYTYLESKGIKILKSKYDLLDLKIKNAVIVIEEFGDIFSVNAKDKQLEKLKRFFNRIEHLNNYVIITSAQANFWNKLICGVVRAYLVKSIEFNMLVNGTTLKRKIRGITENTSDYRLDIPTDVFYVINDDEIVSRHTFRYDKNLDSKRDKINPFIQNDERKKR